MRSVMMIAVLAAFIVCIFHRSAVKLSRSLT
jgi:hypothetical protein